MSSLPNISFIKLNGKNIYFRKYFAGKKTILLIHGFAIDSTIWKEVLPNIKNSELICLDLPGYGLNADYPSKSDLKSHTDFIHDFISVFGSIDLVVGYSYGGRVIFEFCKNYHNNIKRVIIVAAPFFPKRNVYSTIRNQLKSLSINRKLARSALHLGSSFPLIKQILKHWGLTDLHNKNLIQDVIEMIRDDNDPIDVMNCIVNVFEPYTDGVMKYQGELVYVYGLNDKSAKVSMAQDRINYYKSGRLFTIKDAYHLIPLETPLKLAEIINKEAN